MATAGSGISIVAFPWLVLQHHNSARDASVVALAMTLPLVLSTLVAGAAVDYFGRRRVSLISDSLSGAAVAAVPLIALGARRGRAQPSGAGRPGLLRGRVRPGRDDGARVDAARGRRPGGLVAGPHQQRLRGGSQPGLHRGPGHRRPDDRHGRRHQHDVDDGRAVRAVHPGDRVAAARGHRQARAARPCPTGVVSGIVEGLALRLEHAGAPDARLDRPGRHRAVPADGKRAVSEVLHRPPPTRAAGLGVDGARVRRRGGSARLRRAVETSAAAHGRADGDPHLRRGDGRSSRSCRRCR